MGTLNCFELLLFRPDHQKALVDRPNFFLNNLGKNASFFATDSIYNEKNMVPLTYNTI